MEWLFDPQIWVALLTLTVLAVVLGIANVVFMAILVDKLPLQQRRQARLLGLALAMLIRIALRFSLRWMLRLTAPLLTGWQQAVSGRDLILFLGGLFLLAKSTYESHQKLEGEEGHASMRVTASLASVLVQIILLDLVFTRLGRLRGPPPNEPQRPLLACRAPTRPPRIARAPTTGRRSEAARATRPARSPGPASPRVSCLWRTPLVL